MSGDPTAPNYYGFNFYHVQTDFEYIGVTTDLGHGWKFDNKAYTYRYWNKQNYNNSATTRQRRRAASTSSTATARSATSCT